MCKIQSKCHNSDNFLLEPEYDYDYDYEMVLLRHTISTMYHSIIFKSCKKTQYITMKCVIGEQTRKVCCPLT